MQHREHVERSSWPSGSLLGAGVLITTWSVTGGVLPAFAKSSPDPDSPINCRITADSQKGRPVIRRSRSN